LATDGRGRSGEQPAPYDTQPLVDYAVEAEVTFEQRTEPSPAACDERDAPTFGLVSHGGATSEPKPSGPDGGAYYATISIIGDSCDPPAMAELAAPLAFSGDAGYPTLATGPLAMEPGWHTYRLEIKGDGVRLLIDEELVLSATSSWYLDGGHVGLWSSRVRLTVRRFAVTAL